nr:hypothetical protein [uncultured Rhodopila sp.]
MDLNPIVQDAFQVVALALLPSILTLLGFGLRQLQARWKFTVSQQLQDAIASDIASVVNTGIGWGRAKLASGEMQLTHVTTGNPFIDQIATAGLAMLSANARASGISADDLARRIVGGIGHAVGNDPSVPTIAPAPVLAPESATSGAASAGVAPTA